MELWIRSQDRRTILKAYRIDVDDKNIIVWDNNYQCSETYMGEYATTERALEILDEIEQIIISKEIYLNDREAFDEGLATFDEEDKKELLKQTFIYEMPKE
jgi:hypothetical protein